MNSLRKCLVLVMLALCGQLARAQTTTGPFNITSTATSNCAQIPTGNGATVAVDVSGTFSATLQPQVVIGAGGTPRNTSVTPFGSTTAQNTITAVGGYHTTDLAGASTFILCASSYASGTATVTLTVTQLSSRAPGSGGGGGGGTVTSVTFTGDGTVLSNTPSGAVTSSGTLNATLANAAAGTFLSNVTGGSTTPSFNSLATYLASPAAIGGTAAAAGNFTTLGASGTISGASETLSGTLAVTGHVTFEGVTSTGATGTGLLVFNNGPTLIAPVLGTPASGTLTNATGYLWNNLANPTGNLSLTMGANTSAFNTTSPVTDFFSWQNTTAATITTPQSSPVLALDGTGFHAAASAKYGVTFQFVPGVGTDAASTFNVAVEGTPTGVVTSQFPGPVAAGSSGVTSQVILPGSTNTPATTANAFSLFGPSTSATGTAWGLQALYANVLSNATTTQSWTLTGGQDASANSVLGNLTLRGASETGAGGATSQGGSTLLTAGGNAATNAASQAGGVEIMPGASTGATQGLQGLDLQGSIYVKGATVTQWNLECESAAMTVTDCGATPTSWLGVAEVVNANSAQIITDGQTFVNASAAVTLGHTVCASGTAGKVTDSAGTASCTNAQGATVGVVMATAGTWVLPDGTSVTASTTLPLIQMNTAVQLPTGGGGSALSAVTGSAAQATGTETAAGNEYTFAGVETANLTSPFSFTDANSTNNNTNGAVIVGTTGTSTGAVPLRINEAATAGDFLDMWNAGTVTNGVLSGGTLKFAVSNAGVITTGSISTAAQLPNIPINQVVSATGAIATIADGNNPLTINCALTSGTTCLTTGETTAATTAGAVEHQITTLTTTTAIPLQITQGAAGPANAAAPNLINISAAAAGGAAGASNAGSVGAGIGLLTGAGSAGGATTGIGGAGGAVTMTEGAGGPAGGTATNNGGNGGGLAWTTGAGGNGGSGAATAGSGGGATWTMGAPGTNSATGTAGAVGLFNITGNSPASTANATGVNAGTVFSVSGVAGGASSNAAGTAGTGSSPSIAGGAGGAGTGTNAVGGAGGSVTACAAGNGGASAGTGANSNGGNCNLNPGAAGTGGSGTAGKAGVVSVGGSNAGFVGFTQGSANTTANTNIPANTAFVQAPAAVTAYAETLPGAAATGVRMGVNASAVVQDSWSGSFGAVSQTGQTAAITTATLCAATANTACGQAGVYRISYSFYGSGTACSSVTAGSVTLNLTWTDANGTAHTTINPPMWDQKTSATTAGVFNFNTALGTEGAGGSYIVSTNGTIIQYATTYTACTTGTGTYNLKITTEELQ